MKAGALLAYLTFFPDVPHSRETLAEILWPNTEPRAARANLRFVLSTLRRNLEPPGIPAGTVLRTDISSIRLRGDVISTDVVEFTSALSTASRATEAEERITALTRGVDLYRGDLLLGYYEDWILGERERFRVWYRNALSDLVGLWEERGDVQRALHYALTAVSVDPLREESHTQLIRLYLAIGDHSSALRQYRKLQRTLRREMKRGPSDATRAFLAIIRKSGGGSALPRVPATVDLPVGEPSGAAAAGNAPPVPAPPPLVVSSARLPIPLTQFIHRPELTQVIDALQSQGVRLLTLTGPAGSGKTRLAIEAAERLRAAYQDAIWYIPVGHYGEPGLLATAVLDALRLQRSEAPEAMEQIIQYLSRQPSLLLLDGFEHLAQDGPSLILELLQRAPSLTCLVTSRIQLRLSGERVIPVPPLSVPEIGESSEQLRDNPSVRLLVERVRLVRPDFEITPANAGQIAELCRRLEGLPLAIELAAPWFQVLSLPEMIRRLDDPLALLISERADLPERHRSLAAAIQWSYDLLPTNLRRFFCRLSVFEGGFAVDAASTALEEPAAFAYLHRLQECSLITAIAHQSTAYFQWLNVVRAFARERVDDGERGALTRGHAMYYSSLAFEAASNLGGPEHEEWLEQLELWLPNFRRALDWCQRHEPTLHLFLASALWRFWYLQGHLREGRARLEQALSAVASGAESAAAEATLGLACLEFAHGDPAGARTTLRQSLDQFRPTRPLSGTAIYLRNLADIASVRGEYELAEALLDETLMLWREAALATPSGPGGGLERRWEIADTLRRSGDLVYCRGDLPAARRHYQECLSLFRDLQDRAGLAAAYTGLAQVARFQGEFDAARLDLREALYIHSQLEDARGRATVQRILAEIAFCQGRFSDAQALLRESLATLRAHKEPVEITVVLTVSGAVSLALDDISGAREQLLEAAEAGERRAYKRGVAYARSLLGLTALAAEAVLEATSQTLASLRRFCETGDRIGLAFALEVAAAVAAERGESARGARLLGAAEALRRSLGAPTPPVFLSLYERHLGPARAALGEAAFHAEQTAGSLLPLHEAVALASLLSP